MVRGAGTGAGATAAAAVVMLACGATGAKMSVEAVRRCAGATDRCAGRLMAGSSCGSAYEAVSLATDTARETDGVAPEGNVSVPVAVGRISTGLSGWWSKSLKGGCAEAWLWCLVALACLCG